MGARRHHHGGGLGHGLHAGGEVRRLAEDGLLLGRALADKVAHHDKPGGDPDPDRKRTTSGCRKPAHRRDDGKARPDRPLGLVLVRAGQPK